MTSSPTANTSTNAGLDLFLLKIPQSFLLQVGTASILLLLLAEKATVETLEAMGQASEELLRGELLPILNFPNQEEISDKS
jgi:hypothetical protein